jgi:hypothetical protein
MFNDHNVALDLLYHSIRLPEVILCRPPTVSNKTAYGLCGKEKAT